MATEKLWTRNFVMATLSGLFSALVFYITMTTLALYAQRVYDAGASLSGLTASIFVIGSVIGRMFCGRTLERIGRKRLLLSANGLFILLSALYLVPMPLAAFLALRTVHGFAFGVVHSALSTIVVSYIPKARLGEGIGFFSLNFVIATALGPFVGMTVSRAFSYTALFVFCTGLAAVGFALALLLRIVAEAQRRPSNHIIEKSALPLAFVILLCSLCYTGVTTFLESYTETRGLSAAAPVFFIVYAAFILAFRPLAGKLLDRRGDNAVMVPTIVFFAASLVVLAFSGTWPLFLLTALLMALGYGNVLNMGQAVAVKAAPPERVALATSTYFMFSDTGMGLGPFLVGLVVTARGFSGAYLAEAVVCAAALMIYLLLHGLAARRAC
ncbi:MAG: MFS transporter [Clostridiales Family XIII bacterium]|jgi:MFS family permease|nr:MFS transporter [Clostridiales Family XIII bacterium]